jgi:nucleotide-binding universal stress UspA family protein
VHRREGIVHESAAAERGEVPEGGSERSGFRNMVVFLDGCGRLASTVEWSAGLAREHGAHLTGVLVEGEEPPGPVEMDARAVFEATARHHGIRWGWRRVSRRQVVDLATFGPFADLAVVARRPWPRRVGRRLALSELLALVYGGPTVLLPPAGAAFPPRRIVVGWNDGPGDTLPLGRAMPLLERADGVEIVLVDRDTRPPSAEAAACNARDLDGRGIVARLRQLSSGSPGPGRALLTRAAALGADLLVVGARSRSQLYGSLPRQVLAEATVPVLMCR